MKALPSARALLLSTMLVPVAVGQDWTDEQLVAACQGFQTESLPAQPTARVAGGNGSGQDDGDDTGSRVAAGALSDVAS